MSECTLCKRLCKFSKINCISGYGPEDADLLFVGEAPGKNEAEQKVPFVGKAGKFLHRHVFKGAGVDTEDVRLTNAVRCQPPNKKDGSPGTPTIAEIRNCYEYLEEEIRQVKPKVIVALGNVPLHSLIPIHRKRDPEESESSHWKHQGAVTGITKWRGKALWHPIHKCYVVPTFHPSALMHDFDNGIRYRLDYVIKDVELAMRLCDKAKPKIPKVHCEYIQTSDRAVQILEEAIKADVVSFDIETEGLEANSEISLWGFSLSYEDHVGYYIDWDVVYGHKDVMRLFKRFVTEKNHLKVLHNVAFDNRFLQFKWKSVKLAFPYVDTMIAAGMLDENFNKGLKELVWRHLPYGGHEVVLDEWKEANGIRGWKKPEDLQLREEMKKMMAEYGVMDAVDTLLLWRLFESELHQQNLWPLYTKVIMPVRDVLTEAEVSGFTVNKRAAEKLLRRCEKVKGGLASKAFKAAGQEFNERSPKQLRELLYTKLKVLSKGDLKNNIRATKTGYSCDEDSLIYIAKHGRGRGKRVAQVLLDVRFLDNQMSKFIKPIIDNVYSDGKIHTRYNLAGTVTGRTSCSNPGIHNVPRDRLIRSLFTASDGCKLVTADVKRSELVILAAYCQDPSLLEALKGDPHAEIYKLMFGKPDDYVPNEDERFIGKTINFGLIYGRGAFSLAKALGCSIKQAEKYIETYFSVLPKVKAFLANNIRKTKKAGYALSFFKRRRRLPDISVDDKEVAARCRRQANNSIISSVSADYTYMALVRISKRLKKESLKAKIIHTVHDCAILDVPIEEVPTVKLIVKECFEKRVKALPIQMRVDISVTNTWGENNDSNLDELLKKYEEVA